MSGSGEPAVANRKSLADNLTFWVGAMGSLITVVLTVWNAHTKNQIDLHQKSLDELKLQLESRSTNVEESKERVERYKWVFSLLPALAEKDEFKRNFTISLIRLALSKDEAEQLFAGLRQSKNEELRDVGQVGFEVVENQALSQLVTQMNASSADVRKRAVANLKENFSTSPAAVAMVLDQFRLTGASALSAAGAINGLFFLNNTDPIAWTPESRQLAIDLLARLEARATGPQTAQQVESLKAFLANMAQESRGPTDRTQ